MGMINSSKGKTCNAPTGVIVVDQPLHWRASVHICALGALVKSIELVGT